MKLLALGLALTLTLCPSPQAKPDRVRAARAFLETLSEAQRERVLMPLSDERRDQWAYTPGPRPGISWGTMSEPQRKAAHALLAAFLSEEGYRKVEAIRELEPILREMERGNPGRDLERYWFMFFGDPRGAGDWTWRYEGHHVSLSFTSQGGVLTGSTPQFLGSNPAEVHAGPKRGDRVLAKEQDLAFALVEQMTPQEWARAQIGQRAPADLVTTNARVASIASREGLEVSAMTPESRRRLRALIEAHAEVQLPEERARRLRQVDRDLSSAVFAWMGPRQRKGRHYYRIVGQGFLIEYDNTQEDGNHIHTVWRRPGGDFRSDALAEHYRTSDHHRR